jgi:methionyl-tRNA synthetase
MTTHMSKFYISTPIYYPNGEPHLGHAYTTICADVLARYHRLAGDDTFFLTGTDEHGIKMVKTAAEQGLSPEQLANRNVAVFQQVWQELGVTNDDFIRTTSERHKSAVQRIVAKLVEKGDIYLGGYSGWYDEGQEEFVTETEAKSHDFKSAVTGKPLVRYSEPSYFFRLGKYVPAIQAHIESNPHFIRPESRRNEVLSKLRQGVADLSISRSSLKWGIPLPNDAAHVVYVWIDALSNYITALGYSSADDARHRTYWPAEIHLIGKEILWFHTVYWPAVLLALGEPLPKQVFAHGWWTADGKKMSKTLGNFIDLNRLRTTISAHGLDALRFYLLRAAPFGSDLDWSDADFAKAYNELKNVLGNCLNRTLKMIANYRGGSLPAPGGPLENIDVAIQEKSDALHLQLASAYANLELQQCAMLPLELARAVNGYIDATAPFKLAKDPASAERLDTVLNVATQAIYRALAALLPIMPSKAAEGLAQMNISLNGRTLGQLLTKPLAAGLVLGSPQPLFPPGT